MEWLNISFVEEEVTAEEVNSAEDEEFNMDVNNNVEPSTSNAPDPEPPKTLPKRRQFACGMCSYSSSSRGNLYRHKKCVHAKVKHTCSICSKKFGQAYDLHQHRKSVHDNIKLMCEICSKTFNNRFTLRRHRLVLHTGEVKNVCRMCGKKFFDKSSYIGHINNHINAKPYCCPICKKAFAYKSSLQRHTGVCENNDPDKFNSMVKILKQYKRTL